MQLIPGVLPLDQAQIDYAHGILRSFGPAGAAVAALRYDELPAHEHKLVARYVADMIAHMKASGAPEDALVDVLLVAVRFDRASTEAWNQGAFAAVLLPALRNFGVHDMWWAVQRLCRLIGFICIFGGRNDDYVQALLSGMENALASELARWPRPPLRRRRASSPDSLTIAIVCDYRLADLSGIHYLMRSLEAYHRRFAGRDRRYLVIEQTAITETSAPYRARIEAAGVTIVTYDQSASDPRTPVGFGNLSSVCAKLAPDIAVFYCSFPFAMLAAWCRLAPVQAYWSSSFDAAPSRHIELLLSGSSTADGAPVKTVSGRRWIVTPPLYSVAPHPVEPVRRDGPRGHLGRPLFATVGGAHKYENDAFMGMLAQLLNRFPEAAFLCTARPNYPSVRVFFQRFGISDRCHCLGYTDVDALAPEIDVHLDSFPYGTAEAALRMLARGCPTVGMAGKDSLYGYIYQPLLVDGFKDASRLDRARGLFYPPGERPRLLIANTIEQYLDLVTAVARDPEYRAACAEAYRAVFVEVLADGAYSVEAWRRALSSALGDGTRPDGRADIG